MSISVIAIPYALSFIIGSLVTTVPVLNNINLEETSIDNEIATKNENIEETCNDFHIISEANFLEKSLETPFMDENILLKTLEEHGVQNIKNEFGKIQCEYNSYFLVFEKNETNKPYYLTIKYLEKDNVEEKINDLHSEYALNVQEDAYLNIVEKIKDNNMQIENEEVLDDNTIVLTINLEN